MKRAIRLLLIIVFSLALTVSAPFAGSHRLTFDSIFNAESDDPAGMIFWEIRFPRVCLAFISGAGLATAGMAFQALFRNSLATPFTLGISSGASLGAAIGVRLGWSFSLAGLSAISLCAMCGSLVAIAVVYGLTRIRRDCSAGTMLLAGVAVNFFFSSLILLIQYTADFYDTFRILRWMMGGLQLVGSDAVLQVFPFVLAGAFLLFSLTGELNLLTAGEEIAISRGVAAERIKKILFFFVSCMVGVIVSVCGPVGFVGLMCPHICRLITGSDHKTLLPATFFFGGAFLVVCDTVARTAFAPAELPVGIFTSFLGGPFFLWLLLKPEKDVCLS